MKRWEAVIVFLLVLTTSKGVVAVELFNINHEVGNFSEYTNTATDGGDLSVSSAAALNGSNYGLRAVINDNNSLFAYKDVVKTTNYRYRFYFDPNSISMANNDRFMISHLYQNGGSWIWMDGVDYYRNSSGVYYLSFGGNDDAGAWSVYDEIAISDSPHYIEIAMVRATTAVSSNGSYEWWVDGVSQGLFTGIDNYNLMNDQNWTETLCADSVDTGTRGTIYFDDFKANNDGGQIGAVNGKFPASTNFKLEGYSLGGAGSNQIASPNYSMQGAVGELDNGLLKGNNFNLGAGLAFVRSANAPIVATFDNPGNYYNKLHLVVGTQNNSTDTKYAIAISPDNFVTTYFVKSDNSVGTTLALSDYQTYDQWGNSGGITINGLQPSTTYTVKIKAMQGRYTETDWGPTASVATVSPQITFDIDVSPTDTETASPYTINLGDLNPGNVVTSGSRIWVDFETNATSGGSVFVYGQNAGLKSAAAGYTIATTNGDLGLLGTGFGAQAVGATQSSGGPLTVDMLYDLSGSNIGLMDNAVRQIFLSNLPITAGRASFVIKAKSDNNVPSAGDYTEALTVVACANY